MAPPRTSIAYVSLENLFFFFLFLAFLQYLLAFTSHALELPPAASI